MSLTISSRFTYHCPLARLNGVRWTVGALAASLWFRVGFAALSQDEMLWTMLLALVGTQAFGTVSSAILMLRPRHGVLSRLTDWYGIVASVMTWVIGVGAVIWNGIGWLHGLLLFVAVATGVCWLSLIHFGLHPIHLGAIERE